MLTPRELKRRVGTRDKDGKRILPLDTITGTPAHHNQIQCGIGRPYFVCMPNNTYRMSDDERKMFTDYANSLRPSKSTSTTKSTPSK